MTTRRLAILAVLLAGCAPQAKPETMMSTQTATTVRLKANSLNEYHYGIELLPPWDNGGSLFMNFPEHFEHGFVGYGVIRHNDKSEGVHWKVADDGLSASYKVESPDLPGVTVVATAKADGHRAHLSMKITNGGEKALENLKPMLCMHYSHLTGFPGPDEDNYKHTWLHIDGKPITVQNAPAADPTSKFRVGYVPGAVEHDKTYASYKSAAKRGGLLQKPLDAALIGITSLDDKRKVVLGFTPGKSILTNAMIPCIHADPFMSWNLKPGESVEVRGLVRFTEGDMESAMREAVAGGLGKPMDIK